MKMRITDATGRAHIGFEFDSEDNPIILADGSAVYVERVLQLPEGMRFISSNFIIDAQEQ